MSLKAIRRTPTAVKFERDGEALLASRVTMADHVQNVLRDAPAGSSLFLSEGVLYTLNEAMVWYWSALAAEVDEFNGAASPQHETERTR